MEIGLSLPVYNGMDISYGFGSMFMDQAHLEQYINLRLFLSHWQSGIYIATSIFEKSYIGDKKRSKALNKEFYTANEKNQHKSIRLLPSIGYSFGRTFYGEVDIVHGFSAPIDLIPEFGLRLRM